MPTCVAGARFRCGTAGRGVAPDEAKKKTWSNRTRCGCVLWVWEETNGSITVDESCNFKHDNGCIAQVAISDSLQKVPISAGILSVVAKKLVGGCTTKQLRWVCAHASSRAEFLWRCDALMHFCGVRGTALWVVRVLRRSFIVNLHLGKLIPTSSASLWSLRRRIDVFQVSSLAECTSASE